MANIKSAKKRILVNETKAARNKAIKSKVKTAVKKVEAAVAAKDTEAAKAALHRDFQGWNQGRLPQKDSFQKDCTSFQSCRRYRLIRNKIIKKTSTAVRWMSFLFIRATSRSCAL